MKDPRGQGWGDWLAAVATLLALLLAPPAAFLFYVYNSKFRECVRLENGLNLGYEAVFDLEQYLFLPIVVPRFPDGTPVIRDDLWAVYVTDTTIYGLTFAAGDESGGQFAWRADTGLVLENEQPALYEALVAEAGPANRDFGTGSYGTGVLFNELAKRPGFKTRWCRTALVTW